MQKPKLQLKLFAPKYWPMWLGLFTLRLLAFIPYRLMKILSFIFSYIFYPLAKRRTHIIETNINLCFPEKNPKERQSLYRKAFTSTIMSIFEFSLGWWGRKNQLTRLHEIEGLEHLENALKKGKGVILVSSHFTTMEIAGACLCQHLDNLVLTYKRSNNLVYEYAVQKHRLEKSAGLIKHKNLREMLRSIKQGNVVWIAPDQDFGKKDSVFAPFMGIETSTLLSTQRMAKLTGAPVITFYGARIDAESKYILRLSPALENFPSDDDRADATAINHAIEQQIKQAPEQYLWAHRRFKTRPKGEKDFYTK